ncbi:histidine--tRNA ligase [bacterium]|nr:histidine--tRNA ligase [candidate division CSSED10-310 bacterium]
MQQPKLSVQAYKGTRDFYPEDMGLRSWMFNTMAKAAESFGYEPYDGPMLEAFELYAAKSGQELVTEQLYHFHDRGNRHVAIRPEMTPTVARMVAARIHDLTQPIRWYSIPNLWRYERPQRGRLREHWQLNVDIFGPDGVIADQEIIEVAIEIMNAFGAGPDDYEIRISNRRLLNFFLADILQLDANGCAAVCRVIDKKDKVDEAAYFAMLSETGLTEEKISNLNAFTSLSIAEMATHPASHSQGARELIQLFEGLRLSDLSAYCRLDLGIVRGLDYYTGTVFEMFDKHPENRRALFGGGRYDDLTGLFSNVPLPGVGFGMGDVTVMDFLKTHNLLPELSPPFDIFFALTSQDDMRDVFHYAREFRRRGFRTATQLEPIKLNKQLKQANQRKIPFVALRGPDERARNLITVKNMFLGEQVTGSFDDVVARITDWMACC